MALYLMCMDVKKEEFIGTGAWYFCILNLFKVPFLVAQGLITPTSLAFDLKMVPFVVAGSFAGVWAVKKINQQWFERVVLALAVTAGMKLLVA
jgi:uncharacterized membrane protein YfcA